MVLFLLQPSVVPRDDGEIKDQELQIKIHENEKLQREVTIHFILLLLSHFQ